MYFPLFQINRTSGNVARWGAVLMVALCVSCGKTEDKKKDSQPDQPKDYPVVTVEPQSTVLDTDYPATLQGQQNTEIRPKIDGYIDKIYVDEGATVRKGQPLFRIFAPQYEQDVRNAQAAIKIAEADVNAAQMQVNKVRPLVEKDIISKYELESAEYTLQSKKGTLAQAQATLANARTNLGYTTVTSPVDGVIGLLPLKLGSLVSSSTSTALTTVSSIQNVYAYFSLTEKQLLDFFRDAKGNTIQQKLKTVPPVSLVLSDGTIYSRKGRVETASGLVTTETGSASFRATFPNPEGFLRSGATGSVRLSSKVNDALIIPQKTTYELQGKHLVYVVGADSTVKSTEVFVKPTNDGQSFIVERGLKKGERIVLEGISTLKDGTKIKPAAAQTSEIELKKDTTEMN
ncbi:MAG: efflux RND transporter periplasmic adaptor subunit [Siphonobacter sp.]